MNELPGWVRHATVWLLLALALFLGVQTWLARQQAPRFSVAGGTLELQRGLDGHYHWPGRIDGRSVDFLVDTGATGTAIPAALARELALPVAGRVRSSTANGLVVADVVVADVELEGGVQARGLRVVALPGLAAPLLGMDVLGKLRWQQAGGVLRLELGPAR